MTRTEEALERLIIVGGAPRSGTTLVQNMLGSHPEIVGAPEFLHLPDIIRLRTALHDSIAGSGRASGVSTERVDRLVREMILGFLLPLWRRQDRPRLSEKTPDNVLVFAELATLLPESRFLHVVRDPRGIVASMLEVARKSHERGLAPPSYTTSVGAACEYTRRCLESGFRAVRGAPELFLTVPYERLVTEPVEESRRICEFLDVPWTPSMLEPAASSQLAEAVMTERTNEIWYDRKSFVRNPETDSIDKWRVQLTAQEQTAVLRAFSDLQELAELGYGG